MGGTLDAPAREPIEPTRLRRFAWRTVGWGALFAFLTGVFWVADALGWRKTVAAVSCLLLLVGIHAIRFRVPRGDAIRLWKRERQLGRETAPTPEALAENARLVWTFIGGILIAFGTVGLLVALRGE